ncbi:MAG: glycosyltransferase family 4 protein [Thermofilaceae archaeon]|nr:glycosyltransferase family 4 protein [Thermofilaceae archaeon]
MKVVLCSDYFYPKLGGITTHVEYLAKSLEKRGHEVVVLTKKAEFDDRIHGLNVVRVGSLFNSSNPLDVPNTSEIEYFFSGFKPDVVHSHHAFSPLSLFAISVAKKLGIATVLTTHSIQFMYDFDLLWRPSSYVLYPIRQMINEADRIIAVSRAAKTFIRYFTRKDVTVIPNGVCVNEFALSRKLYDGRSILFVGRLVYRKGVHLLLDLMQHVLHEVPEANLTVAGAGYLAKPLRYLAKTRGLREKVTLVLKPERQELIELYRRSNVFVMPSIYGESFGIVLLEAMASKTPIVAINQGGIGEVVKHGETGFLVNKGEVETMAHHVARLLRDRGLAKLIADKAYKEVRRYDWSVIVRRIEKVYEDVLGERKL